MDRTELITKILKLTGHKRSLHPDVHFGLNRLLDKYEQSNIRTMDNPDQEEGKRPERPDDDEG